MNRLLLKVFSFTLLFVVACSGNESVDNSSQPGDETPVANTPQPVQVFLMAGQSNMVGYGPLLDANTGDWPEALSLDAMIQAGSAPAALLETRDDVWVHFQSTEEVQVPGLLRPGFGGSSEFFGPELGFGEILGDAFEAPIVCFKSATGGTTLGGDWRPPSAVARAGGEVGHLYENMVMGFKDFLEMNLNATFPREVGNIGYEVAGFVWLQGWNDQFEDGFVEAYEDNLVDLIHDVRGALELPELPVLIVEGPTFEEDLRQARVAALERLEAEQPGTTFLVETNDLVNIEVEGNFHFNFNAHNYLEVGRRMAQVFLGRAQQ